MIVRFRPSHSASAQIMFICSIFLLLNHSFTLSIQQGGLHSLEGEPTAQQPLQEHSGHLAELGFSQQLTVHAGEDVIREDDYSGQSHVNSSTYTALIDALEVMQSHFFEISVGIWPHAIDWTAAVMGTQVSATLSSMTEYSKSLTTNLSTPSPDESRDHENLINRYFTQITSFYFGENAFSLRTQAYDDMLWVVLGWLEAIKFIDLHSSLHYSLKSYEQNNSSQWYARQFIPQYAHRAHVFYNLASKGWDTSLCGGGMTWNPYLAPYKNAITNELYIAASIGMYLHFPGDCNNSPFVVQKDLPPAKAHDVQYLENAVEAYKWLKGSGMRNEQGLYVDGFHIKGWRGGRNGSNGTEKCDLRDESVYTYNQGVLLSGLRGLWVATSSRQYLLDGHELVQSVIAATGWEDKDTERKWRWAGLGRGGIMEDQCDWSGTCSQNAQTFKGIFFHHLTLFCSPLPKGHDDSALHQQSCDGYADWIRHNAFAAYITRDEKGEFGEWWGRPTPKEDEDDDIAHVERSKSAGTDYRNEGVPRDQVWRLPEDDVMYRPWKYGKEEYDEERWEGVMGAESPHQRDINDRGRGRTVETQSGGIAVLRALWKLVESRQEE